MSDSQRIINYDDYPQASYYGYRPDEGAAIAFIVIFSILALAQVIQGVRYKYWIVFPTIVAGCVGMSIYYIVKIADDKVRSSVGLVDYGLTKISTCRLPL
jgi:hypothetical protein